MAGSADPEFAELEAAVSAAVERLYLDRFGKAPLHTETIINGDVIVTLMREVFSPVERALLEAGRSETVLTTRMLWQEATDREFKDAVSEVIGRRVTTVISGYDVHADAATEVFVLDPRTG